MICQVQRWKDLNRWVPGGDNDWECLHTLLPLDDLLTPRTEHVRVKQTLGEWTPITIHFDGSVVPRERNTPFKGAMFAAYPGDLVFSKIDVRNGAIGLVPDSMPQVVVTSEYPVHTPDTCQVDARYMTMLLRTPNFLKLIRTAASGTSGRKRITPENFRLIEIPLPEPKDQRRLVAAYQKAQDKAAQLDAQAQQIERDAQREFEAALGLTPPPNLPKRPYQIAHFRDIERWSHEGILQDAISRTVRQESTFAQPALGEVAEIAHGCSHPPSAKPTGLEILKISGVTRGDFHPEERKFIRDTPELRVRFDLQEGDILMCRTNGTLAYVGMAALVLEDMPNLIFPDKVIRVRLTTPALLPEFLWTLLKSPYMRMKIEANARTAVGNYAIGSSDLVALEVIAPPLDVQKRIANALKIARNSAATKRKQATALRAAAWNDFIAAVFT